MCGTSHLAQCVCASILAALEHAELGFQQLSTKFVSNHAWAELCPSKLIACATLTEGLAAGLLAAGCQEQVCAELYLYASIQAASVLLHLLKWCIALLCLTNTQQYATPIGHNASSQKHAPLFCFCSYHSLPAMSMCQSRQFRRHGNFYHSCHTIQKAAADQHREHWAEHHLASRHKHQSGHCHPDCCLWEWHWHSAHRSPASVRSAVIPMH